MRRVELASLGPAERRRLVRRSAVSSDEVREGASRVIDDVRSGGDAQLALFGQRLGGGIGTRVGANELDAAVRGLGPELRDAIDSAAANIRMVHAAQVPTSQSVEPVEGVVVERRWAPLRRVGCYVPGGRAPLPSTLLMTVVPAQAAGVASIAVATPARGDGTVDPVVLGAAAMLGVDEVWAMGGAQAVAALAYGTETIEAVQKIVGPGNAWVTAAKILVSGEVSIDMPAGPSEALVLADGSADPRFVAADLLAQAEHGEDSPVVLVTDDTTVADAVVAEVERMLATLERRTIIDRALADHGLVIVAADRDQAIRFADDFAPEHLSLHITDAADAIDRISGAGSVFVGPWSPEPVGDYASGANHVLPTGGLAASMGPLSTEDFGTWRQVQTLTRQGLAVLRPTVAALAVAEGLTAHFAAVEVRFEESA
jgi:histidinol dehydrogenase